MAGMLLAQNNSKIIGVIINNHCKYEQRVLQDPFISSSIDYLSEVIEREKYFMMIKCTASTKEIIQIASMWNMEGLVLIGYGYEDYEKLRSSMHIPFVVYDGFFDKLDRFANISIDDYSGGFQVGQYLVHMGHEKIMYLSDNKDCTDEQRFLGLKAALEEAEIVTPEEMFFLIPENREERYKYYKKHLKEMLHYTAAFAASDVYAIEFMNFLNDKGIKVPDEISVVGFDDIPACEMVRPRLTTIHQDGMARAELAMEMLIKQKKQESIELNRLLKADLVIRESVKQLSK